MVLYAADKLFKRERPIRKIFVIAWSICIIKLYIAISIFKLPMYPFYRIQESEYRTV